MSLVQVIPAYNVLSDAKETVAAYCRVSSKSTDQLHSYRAQVSYYTNLISSNSNWELVDIYADKGITGTSIDKRDEFQRMMEDCRAGKIKRILVKSVSRFARNSIELIEATRELKQLGVVVVFEEQGIDTSQMLGEMHLTMFAIAAQEESYSISNNMRWSYCKRMESGKYITNYAPYGYDLANKKLIVNQTESAIVQQIFQHYLAGSGKREIVSILNQQGVLPRRGTEWKISAVDYILSNEKYIGDTLLQKKYTSGTLPFNKKRNRGQLLQYYWHGTHEPIIREEDFANTKSLAEHRSKVRNRSPHLFTHRIICPDCGRHYRQATSSGKSYWLCPGRVNKIADCHAYRLPEEGVKDSFLNMAGKLYTFTDTILAPVADLLLEIDNKQDRSDRKLYEINQAISDLNDKILVLQRLFNKGFIDDEDYRDQNSRLAIEQRQLNKTRKKLIHDHKTHETAERIESVRDQIRTWDHIPIDFDIQLFDSLVEKVIPACNGMLLFKLHCGLEFLEAIPT